MPDWRKQHGAVIADFLRELNRQTSAYVLKGGTSLMMCYNLDRFSEDIDLDSRDKRSIVRIVRDFCDKYGYTFNINKDTDVVKRFMIHYADDKKPLKVEVSYREYGLSSDNVTCINNIQVYNIDTLATLKINAYTGRSKIRDLYDVVFICKNHWEELTDTTKGLILQGFTFKGFDYFDYISKQQADELIDINKLGDDFLEVLDNLGLLDTLIEAEYESYRGEIRDNILSIFDPDGMEIESIADPVIVGSINSEEDLLDYLKDYYDRHIDSGPPL